MALALKSSARRGCAWSYAVKWAACGAAAAYMLSSAALGAEIPAPIPHPERDFSTYTPTGKATRIAPAEAPTIDGDLSDAAWAKAEPIDELYQLDPDTGQPGTSAHIEHALGSFGGHTNSLHQMLFQRSHHREAVQHMLCQHGGRVAHGGEVVDLGPLLNQFQVI